MSAVRGCQVERDPTPRDAFGIREIAISLIGVLALAAGAVVFLADRFHLAFMVVLIAAWGFGLRRATRVVRSWRIEGTSSPSPAASDALPWRPAAAGVSLVLIIVELTLIGAALFLQLTPNENWVKLYVLGSLAVPASLLIGPMLLVQQRWSPGRAQLDAEAASPRGTAIGGRRAVVAVRVLAATSWALALLLTLAVIGLLVVVVQAH